MARFLFRFIVAAIVFAVFRAVERRFGLLGVFVFTGVILAMPLFVRVVGALLRAV